LLERDALEHRLPAHDATHNYLLLASRGAFYWSPISHAQPQSSNFGNGKNRQDLKIKPQARAMAVA
jgi:hypothetical protein